MEAYLEMQNDNWSKPGFTGLKSDLTSIRENNKLFVKFSNNKEPLKREGKITPFESVLLNTKIRLKNGIKNNLEWYKDFEESNSEKNHFTTLKNKELRSVESSRTNYEEFTESWW